MRSWRVLDGDTWRIFFLRTMSVHLQPQSNPVASLITNMAAVTRYKQENERFLFTSLAPYVRLWWRALYIDMCSIFLLRTMSVQVLCAVATSWFMVDFYLSRVFFNNFQVFNKFEFWMLSLNFPHTFSRDQVHIWQNCIIHKNFCSSQATLQKCHWLLSERGSGYMIKREGPIFHRPTTSRQSTKCYDNKEKEESSHNKRRMSWI